MNSALNSYRIIARLRENPKSTLIISALAGFGLSILLIGKLVFSGYSILDDHDVVEWFGPDHRLALSNIWSTLMSTEVGHYGPGIRFRPVMYFLSIFQTWLWGPHPSGYHVVAVFWFGFFLSAVAWACFRSIGVIAGCAVLFLVVNGHYWGNIFTHSTMVSEQPALFGLGLVVFGAGLICTWFMDGCRTKIDRALVLISIGSLIAVGSKENFMPPVGLGVVLLAWAWKTKKIGAGAAAACAVLLLLGVAICLRIIIPNIGQGVDMYGYDNHISSRLKAVYHSSLFKFVALAIIAGTIAAVMGARARASRDTRDARANVVLGAILIFSGLYLAWEIFFYTGRLPFGNRYDFPGLLIFPVFAGTAFFIAAEARKHIAWIAARFSPFALKICFALLILNVATAYFVAHRLLSIRTAIAISNNHTQAMWNDLAKTKIITSAHPSWPIIVVVSHPLDYEPVFTLPTWLHFFDIPSAASVLIAVPPLRPDQKFERQLVQTLQGISEEGMAGRYVPMTPALQTAQAAGHCYIISFEKNSSRCTPLPYHPSEYYPVD